MEEQADTRLASSYKFEIFPRSISRVVKDILPLACNWDDLRLRTMLASVCGDSESAACWLTSVWQMLIKCALDPHLP